MGRTNRTFRDLLRGIERRWGDYRRALRRRDQSRFDRLFTYARRHADAASYLNHETPLFPALVGIDLEQERRLDALDDRLRAVESGSDERAGDERGADGRVDGPDDGDPDDGDPDDASDGNGATERPSTPSE
ncbi:hypothetical protein ACFPYI_17205 [Halomarina salina]|uniref:DUF8156 domain-containing protein n=1 Tax=Halomarina salina TaxID=1872699 RepID=A0ABD5RRX2_9EURY|nr:hypothetical protein [Halomarina salina]